MADDDDEKAALARLRMFLAPHAPFKDQHGDDTSPHQADAPEAPATSVAIDATDVNDQVNADLSTLADQFKTEVEVDAVTDGTKNQAQESDASYGHGAEYQSTPPPAAAVATVSPLLASSKEFNRVKYLLQYSMPGFRVHDDLLMWDMKNPGLAAQYEERAGGLLELDSWVEVDELSAAMSEVHAFGFSPVATDIHAKKFTTGVLRLDPAVHKRGRKQLVLCRIAVGKSLLVKSDEDAENRPLPPGYHSYHVVDDTPTQGYTHDYILSDAMQIQPQYLVRFSFSALEMKPSQACALCEKSPATLVCKACDADLCAKCDVEVHSANKLVGRHKRTPKRDIAGLGSSTDRPRRRSSTPHPDGETDPNSQLSTLADASTSEEVNAIIRKQLEDGMNEFTATCSLHSDKKIDFFCPVCAVPVCVNCKMVGDHSIGDKGAHRLLSISDAYERSLRESFKTDALVESRKTVIENKLAQIAAVKRDVQANREQAEASIKQQFEQTLTRLEEEAQKKTQVLSGEAMELQRQLQHIDWLEDCLDEQRSTCSVIEFLSSWSHHKLLRAEQRDFPLAYHANSTCEQVKADLQVLGQLQVVAGEHFERARSFTVADRTDLRLPSGPTSPRGSIGAMSPSLQSIRRMPDNEIRRKLLSVRPVEPTPVAAVSSVGLAALSPEGLKMMEEIRRDLLSRGSFRSSYSVGGSIQEQLDAASTPNAFSINPARSPGLQKLISSRSSIDTWTALLRREMGLAGSKQ